MLLAEYAIEPQALSSWDRFRYVADMCGISTGRLIADFPNNWCRAVLDVAEDIPPVAKSRVVERLKQLKQNALISLGREFDVAQSWQDNALSAHGQMEFKAIIASSPQSAPMLDIAFLDTSDDAWKVPRELAVPRTAEDLGLAASYLLMMSSCVVFVDPYFSPQDRRCRKPLMEFLGHLMLPISRLEFHLCSKNSGSADHFLDMLKTQLLPDLRRLSDFPKEQQFFFIRWNELPTGDGEAAHPRYILTNKGGLRFEYGLAEKSESQTTDVSLLDEALYQKRFAQYKPDSGCFEFADGWCIQNGQVLPVTIENGQWAVKS